MTLKGENELLQILKGIEKQLEIIAYEMRYGNKPK